MHCVEVGKSTPKKLGLVGYALRPIDTRSNDQVADNYQTGWDFQCLMTSSNWLSYLETGADANVNASVGGDESVQSPKQAKSKRTSNSAGELAVKFGFNFNYDWKAAFGGSVKSGISAKWTFRLFAQRIVQVKYGASDWGPFEGTGFYPANGTFPAIRSKVV
jgi:hypothetical protein